jgi:hypothetical protein
VRARKHLSSTVRDREGVGCRFEAVEEILLATGELVSEEAVQPPQSPENTAIETVSALSGKVVPRSEAILSHGSPDAVRRREDLQEQDLDKRVHAPSAHELGIAKGMLVQVVAKVRVRPIRCDCRQCCCR